MAERRMFAKTIIDSDAFLDMSVTARLLYYDLAMRADDDGFVNSPKKIMRIVGASEDDLRMLALRKFIIPFDNGVVVIKHWKIHNYIRKDTYSETPYKEQKALLGCDENGAYMPISQDQDREPWTTRRRPVDDPSTQDRLGKDRLGKDSIELEADKPQKHHRFIPPAVDDVAAYCKERGNRVSPQRFVDFYTAKNWMIGKSKMTDWKAAVRTWEQRDTPKDISSAKNYDYEEGESL